MIQSGNQKERHALPRWSSLNTAQNLGEMSPTKTSQGSPPTTDHNRMAELLGEWSREKSLPLAVDIISTAKLSASDLDLSDIVMYARHAVDGIKESTPLLQELLFDFEDPTPYDPEDYPVCIGKIKKALISNPRNPLLWSELSREYTILGQEKKSARAIHIAYSLAPESRTVLRAIARFYSHNGDIEQALFYLRKSPLLKTDPWIISSEIALSNELGRTSPNVKLGQQMLLNMQYHPLAVSELASELGTMDFLSGSSKQGKRKLEIATQVPHENAIAQIIWINKNAYRVESIMRSIPETRCNYEAEAQLYHDAQEWEKALEFAKLWQEYQPFSRKPALISSFVATDFLMDFMHAEKSLVRGLHSNPTDHQLLNNYVYVLALSNQLDKANAAFTRAMKYSPDDDVPLIATAGLLSYRQGDDKAGKDLYLKAIATARQQKNTDLMYRATLCFAREEKRCGHPVESILSSIEGTKYSTLRKQYDRMITNFGLDVKNK